LAAAGPDNGEPLAPYWNVAADDHRRPPDAEDFDELIRETEQIRGYVERQLRQRPFYPERRRTPRHWDSPEHDSEDNS
jgi:hypothetical protein